MGKLLIGIGVIFALMGVFGSMIPLVILGVIVALVGEKLGEKKQNEVKEQLGDQIICEVLHDVFQDVEYQMQGHISRGVIDSANMMFQNGYNEVKGSDDVKAVYRGRKIELSNVTLSETAQIWDEEMQVYRETETVSFKGQWFLYDTGIEHMADVQIAPRTRVQRLIRDTGIQMPDEEFNKRFNVRSAEEQEAFRILTTRMMEYILRMADSCDGSIYISFLKNGIVHVAANTERDFLNVKKEKGDIGKMQERFRRQVQWFTDFTDEIH